MAQLHGQSTKFQHITWQCLTNDRVCAGEPEKFNGLEDYKGKKKSF